MAAAWCDFGDLPADQCACPRCAPDIEPPKPIRWAGSETEARFPGICGHCGQPFAEKAVIAAADVEGNGVSDAWCLLEHTVHPSDGAA